MDLRDRFGKKFGRGWSEGFNLVHALGLRLALWMLFEMV